MNGCGIFAPHGTGGMPGLNTAQAALDSGAGQLALQVSESVLRASPKNVSALEIKGDALTLLGQYDQATPVFLALLAQDPNSARANIGLGRIRLQTEPGAAEPLFQAALKRDPSNLTALNNLGIARDLTGRHAEAQSTYRQALAINPDLASAKVNLALSLAMSGQGAEAIQLLRPEAGQADASPKVKQDYAVVLAMSGYRAEAERVLGDGMAPEDVRQVLDSVTASHPRTVRDLAPDRGEVRRVSDADPNARPAIRAPESPVQTAAQMAPQAAATAISTAAMAAPIPTVVHPTPVMEADAPAPVAADNPVAAAVATQRPLALTMAIPEAPVQPVAQAPQAPPMAVPVAVPPPVLVTHAPEIAEKPAGAPVFVPAEPVAAAMPEPAVGRVVPAKNGTASVQFVATWSADAAHAFWQSLVQRFPADLGQLDPLVIRIERDGEVFWRVRAVGFDTVSDAQALCARMQVSGQDCYVPRS
jgi:Flp pilus assembly protein TadD